MSRQQSAHRQTCQVRLFTTGKESYHDERACPVCSAAHQRQYGDVISSVPPQLQGQQTVPSGRNSSLAVNPADVQGVPFIVAPGAVPVDTAINLGGGTGTQGLFADKTPQGLLEFRNITPGAGIDFTIGAQDDIIINSSITALTGLANEGTGTGLVFDTVVGTTAYLRSLQVDPTVGNEGIAITTTGLVVNIGNTMTGGNLGTGAGTLFASKTAPGVLNFNSLAGGLGISVSAPASNVITIANTLTGQSIATGQAIYTGQVGAVLQFRGLLAGPGITLAASATDITVTSSIAATAVLQGGNSFGTTMTVGTNDANPLVLHTNGVTALTLSTAQAASFANSITAGVSGTAGGSLTLNGSTSGGLTMSVPAAGAAYALTWPSAQGGANTVLTNNGAGVLSWQTNPDNFFAQGGNAFGAPAILGTTDLNSLALETNSVTALTISASQQAIFAKTLTVSGATITIGGAGAGGSLVLNGSTSGAFTQAVSTAITSYSVTWPAAQATAAGQVLINNGSGILSWGVPGGGTFYQQGGNAFGAAATLGTTDANSLTLITSSIAALSITSAQQATFAKTLTVSGASVTVGTTGTVGGTLVLAALTSGAFTQAAPMSIAVPYTITWPNAAASANGSYLASSTAGALSWNSPNGGAGIGMFLQGGNSFGATAILGTNDANSLVLQTSGIPALTITTAQAATFAGTLVVAGATMSIGATGTVGGSLVLNGLTSGAFTQQIPATVTTYTITWPAAQATAAGQVLVNNGSGALAWGVAGGGTFYQQGGNMFGAAATLGTNDNFPLTLKTNGIAALSITNAQVATFANTLAVAGASIAVGTSGTVGGSLLLSGSTSGAFTQNVPAAVTSYSITWPSAQASAANQVLTNNGSGALSWATPGNFFAQGGNSFGAAAVLGTNDSNSLTIRTNGATALMLSTSQAATFASTLVVSGASLTVGVTGTTGGSLVLSGSTAGALTQNVPATVTTYSVTWPATVAASVGSYLASTTGGILSWNSPNGGAGVGVFLQGGNSFGGTATLGTNDANSLILETNSIAALTITSAQAATFAKTLSVQGASLTVGVAGTTGGSLVLSGLTAGTLTQQVPATVTTYTVTWPAAQGAASTVLTNNGSGILSWTSAASPWSRIADATTSENQIVYNMSYPTAATDNWLAGPQTTEGAGTRAMMINSSSDSGTGSFRAGTVNGTQWNQANRGAQSVAFGLNNTASGAQSGVLSGSGNTAGGAQCVVVGGATNSVATAASGSAILAGTGNSITTVNATYSIICGGSSNAVTGAQAAVIGGVTNTITNGTNSFIGGGNGNEITGAGCFIGAGDGNEITGSLTVNATIGGGQGNSASASNACVPGGLSNTASGACSFACGQTATASLANTFVFNDGSNSAFTPAAANTFSVIASGGMFTTASYTAGSANGTTGSLVLVGNNNTVLSNSLTQTVPSVITGYTITWPGAQASAAGQVLTNNGSGTLSWAAPGGGSFFAQGGNSFGVQATLGTTDNNSLVIKTNNVNALTISNAQQATFAKTLTVQGASLTVGVAGTTGGSLVLAGLTAGAFTQNVPATVTTYGVTWPAAVAAAAGSYLASSTGGVLSWNDPNGGAGVGMFLQGGNSFGATATLGTNDANSLVLETNGAAALTITSAKAATFASTLAVQGSTLTVGVAGTTGGSLVLSGSTAGTLTQNAPATVTTYSITWPAAVAIATGSYLASSTGGVLSWNNPNSGAGIGMFLQGGNSFGATATLGTNDANSIVLQTNGAAALTITSAKAATFASTLAVNGASLTVGVAGTTGGSLVLSGSAAGTLTQNVPATVEAYSITWPSAVATFAGSYLASSTGGALSWNNPNGGAGIGVFLQGGNSFGATATLGTNDANSLVLQTNGGAALTITSSQAATFASTLAVNGASLTIGVAGTTGGSVVLAGSAAGTLTQNVAATITTYSITWPTAQGGASTVLTNNGSGVLSWAAAVSPSPWSRITDATTSESQIVYNTSLPTATTDNWLAGPQTTEGAGTRAMMINSSTDSGAGSFRAGTVNGTQWNQANRGAQSVAFGLNNTASGAQSGVLSGSGNTAGGAQCAVVGGATNSVATAASGSAILAGTSNSISSANATYAIICGGNGNATTGAQSAIIGGVDNTITNGTNSFIGGGNGHTITGAGCFIGAGDGNEITGSLTINATIGGGQSNTASASNACVPGGLSNTAGGVCSFACGQTANASLANTFVFNDGSNSAFTPAATNTFSVIASGGVFTTASYTAGSANGTTGSLVLVGNNNTVLSNSLTQTVPSVMTGYTITWPNAVAAAAGSYLASSTGGALSWNNPNGGAGVGMFLQGGNAFGAAATLGTTDGNGLILQTNSVTALTISNAQQATFAKTLTVAGASVTIGTAGTTGGSLIMACSSSGNFTQLVPATIAAPYSVTWPTAQAASTGQVLTNDGTGILSWTAGSASSFVNGGNSFTGVGPAVLGTTNTFALVIKTNSVTALTIANTQTATFASTVTVSGASVTIGAPSSTSGSIILACSGSANTATIGAPASISASYSVTWPAAQGGAGTVLTNNGSGSLTWATAGAGTFYQNGGNAFGAAATIGLTDTNQLSIITNNVAALVISSSQQASFTKTLTVQGASATIGVAGTTGGSLVLSGSASGTVTQNVPATAIASYAVTWPAAVATAAGSYLVSTTGGVLSWNNPNGGAGVGTFLQGGNSFGATAVLGTNDANPLQLRTNGATAVAISASQATTFSGSVTVNNGLLTSGVAGSAAGTLVLAAGTAGSFTQTTPATISTPYTLTWPAAAPTVSGQALTVTTAGVASWTSVWAQGGNSFGAAGVLGTGDANSLTIQTNGAAALTLTSAQAATFSKTLTVQGASLTVGVSGTTGGSLVLAGAGGGTFTQNVPATAISTYAVTWPAAVATAAGSYLASTTGGVLSWNNPNGGTGVGTFLQGGNSFGATAILGTKDANSLELISANSAALTFSTAQAATFTGAVAVSNGSLTVGVQGSTTGTLFMAGSGPSAGTVGITVPSAVTTYTVTMPGAAAAANGSYLASSTSGTLSWNSPNGGAGIGVFLQGGNSFGGTATLGTNDANSLVLETNGGAALTITSAKAATFASTLVVSGASLTVGVAGTTGGSVILSGATAGTLTQNVPATVTTYGVTWPSAVAASAGSHLASTTGGVLSWNSPNSGAGVGFFLQGGNSFGAAATLGTSDSNSLILKTNNITALTIATTQVATFASTVTVSGASLTVGVAGTTGGSLILAGGTAGALTQNVPATVTTYSMTWPGTVASAAGSYLASTTGGTLSWNSPNGGAGVGMFLQGGNSFGATATLGTNDANNLVLKTNSITALTITSASQAATFAGTLTANGGIITAGVAGTTGGSLVMAGSAAGALTQNVPATVTSYAATWPAAQGVGALVNNGTGTLSWVMPSGYGYLPAFASGRSSSVTIGSTNYVSTGLTATITPQFTNSKILIAFSGNVIHNVIGQSFYVTVARGTTDIVTGVTPITGEAGSSGANMVSSYSGNNGTNLVVPISATWVDSPATVSAVTYTVYGAVNGNSATWGYQNTTPSITLQEQLIGPMITGGPPSPISVMNTTTTQVSGTPTTYTTTGFSATITPQYANSKVFITVSGTGYMSSVSGNLFFTIARGTTDLATGITPVTGISPNTSTPFARITQAAASSFQQFTITFLDSPATTAATTYTLYYGVAPGSGTGYWLENSQSTGVMTLQEEFVGTPGQGASTTAPARLILSPATLNTTTPTSLGALTYTFPTLGGPYRAFAQYNVVSTATAADGYLLYVTDGTNTFAGSQQAQSGTVGVYGGTGSGISYNATYAAGQTVTFTMFAQVATPSAGTIVQVASIPANNDTRSYLVIYAVPA
jgi:fibronectin-binding autotransporter adhesin